MSLHYRERIEPEYRDLFGAGAPQLYYSHRTGSGKAYTPHESIAAIGQDWEWILRHTETGEYRHLETAGQPLH